MLNIADPQRRQMEKDQRFMNVMGPVLQDPLIGSNYQYVPTLTTSSFGLPVTSYSAAALIKKP